MKIIAATGHRLGKLGGYRTDVSQKLRGIAEKHLLELKPDSVIVGMALGWDQAVALAAIRLRLPFTAALPFEGQDARWTREQRQGYRTILTRAAEVVTIATARTDVIYNYQARNEWMADNCTDILALWDGSPGGTANMIRYATGPGRWRVLHNVWDEWSKNDAAQEGCGA